MTDLKVAFSWFATEAIPL